MGGGVRMNIFKKAYEYIQKIEKLIPTHTSICASPM